MCGRYALVARAANLEAEFSMIRIEWFPPRYNIAPTQPILIVRAESGERRPALVRWGLIPAWAKDPSTLPLFFNARSETAPDKPAFRGPFRYRRCLIPATGFYEWQRGANGRKQPFYIRPVDRPLVALAGLWEEYADDKGNIIDTATILTTAANDDVAPIHDRMPVVIDRPDYDLWLGLDPTNGEGAASLMRPSPRGRFEAIAVNSAVNNARIDDATVQDAAEPIAPNAVEPVAAKPGIAPEPSRQLKLF
jgi:putative SOS response-associated peptidase YedK